MAGAGGCVQRRLREVQGRLGAGAGFLESIQGFGYGYLYGFINDLFYLRARDKALYYYCCICGQLKYGMPANGKIMGLPGKEKGLI